MAEGGSEDNKSNSYTNYSHSKNDKDDENNKSETEQLNTPTRPDLFDDNVLNFERKLSGENLTSNQNDAPRREDNPFSFKHFLNRKSSINNVNYQQTGARPKIFSTNRQHSLPTTNFLNTSGNPEPLRMSSVDNIRSEFPSVLPDFVQDHLVVEQCYLNNDANKIDIDNLPDFTLNRPSENHNQWENNHNSSDNSNNDLTFNLTSTRRRTRVDFPLDLPLSSDNNAEEALIINSGSRSCPQSTEVGVSKSLPDFLSDGPIHSNRISSNISASVNESPAVENTSQRSERSENEHLREEIERLRQQLSEKNLRIADLERDITLNQRKEKNYIEALAKSMEQVEGNLSNSNKRTLSAENTISKLKQEIKHLKSEVHHLRKENSILREHNLGAVGGSSKECAGGSDISTRRLAQELRGAANSAEHSLRNLLTGLNNLRVIADSVENMHRVEERNEYYVSDLEDESGPAL